MFSQINKRFFSISTQYLTKFKSYPAENYAKTRSLVDSIAVASDQTAFYAWHPKKEFPYEFTRPLPERIEQRDHSLLKTKAIEKAKIAYKLSHPDFSRAKLAEITSTTKHRWFPRSRDKKFGYRKIPMERRYL